MPTTESEHLLLLETAASLNSVLAVNFYGRSGSVLMQSLFDGHPDVIVLPGHYFEYLYDFIEQYGQLGGPQLIEEFLNYFNVLFDGTSSFKPRQGTPYEKYCEVHGFTRLGPNRNQQPIVDKEIFAKVLLAIFGEGRHRVERKLFFQSVYLAYWKATGRNHLPGKHTYLFFPLHNHDATAILEDFPQCKFILMTRDPIDNAGSLFRYGPEAGLRLLEHILFAGTAPLSDPEFAVTVRLEDLHNNSRPTMESVCQWLRISWNDCLLQSTFQGLQWWGENKNTPLNGLSPGRKPSAHPEFLFWIDRWRLKVLLFNKAKKWHYEFAPGYGSSFSRFIIVPLLLLPLKIEFISLATLRKQVIEASLQKLPGEGLPRLLKLLYWWCWLGVLEPWLPYRRLLWRAWLNCGKQSTATQLLPPPRSS